MHDNVLRAIQDTIHEIKSKDRTSRPLPSQFMCSECDRPAEHYMVHDAVWREAFDTGNGVCCIDCLEDRLGRELLYQDFKPAPINLSILRGMMMGGEA